MRILIVFPGPLFPLVGMSQVRVLNQLICLSQSHDIVFSDIVSRDASVQLAHRELIQYDLEYKPVLSPVYGKDRIYRAIRVLVNNLRSHYATKTKEELMLGSKQVTRQVLDVASQNIDAIIIHYWYLGALFRQMDKKVLRMIDTHYIVEEHFELMASGKYSNARLAHRRQVKRLNHSLAKQREYFMQSDLVIVNSSKQEQLIHRWDQRIPVNLTVNGQDLTPYLNYRPENEPELAVSFYGSLGNQFNRRALKRILESIFPLIKQELPKTRLHIIGANPPLDIIRPHTDDSILVTGYVEDTRPFLSSCRIMLLPLETGSGFRGRTVEVMAMGIPVIGSLNGLQSVGFRDGEHGYLEETDAGIARRAVELLNDCVLWQKMSQNCKNYAKAKFTLEETHGRLAKEIQTLKAPQRVMD